MELSDVKPARHQMIVNPKNVQCIPLIPYLNVINMIIRDLLLKKTTKFRSGIGHCHASDCFIIVFLFFRFA